MNANSIFTPGLEAAQQPTWPDAKAVAAAVTELESFPPLVFAGECDNLKKRIGQAALGNAFWLQGGIALKPLQLQPLIQLEIELKLFFKWQLFCSTSHHYQ